MMRFPIPFFVLVGTLAACVPTIEDQIQREIDQANHCEETSDCVLVGSKCPFDCYIYANVIDAERIQQLVDEFDSDCEYSCLESFGAECKENRCVAVTEPPEQNKEANVGEACTSHDECVTPMGYLVRSVCPFTSLCINDACAVACPMLSTDSTVDFNTPVACREDSDCTCDTYAPEDLKRCTCVDHVCVAVVEE